LLSSQIEKRQEIVKYFNECRAMAIQILPPNINQSVERFSVEGNTIRFGMAAVKNVGSSAIQSILKGRTQKSEFQSLDQFYEIVDSRSVNKRVVESLIKSGAMDCFQVSRKFMIDQLDRILENTARRERNINQASLFDMSDITPAVPANNGGEDFGEQEKLAFEKESLGFYISGHPLHKYKEVLETFTTPIEALDSTLDGKEVLIGGIVGAIKQIRTRKGEIMAYVELEDLTGMLEVILFPELYKNNLMHVVTDSELIIKGRIDAREDSLNMIASDMILLKDARESLSQQLKVHVYLPGMENEKISRLKSILEQYKGDCNLTFVLKNPEQFTVDLNPAPAFRVRPTRDFVFALEQLLGPNCVEWQNARAVSAIK
jgi:DNA polymerase III subunit alpha